MEANTPIWTGMAMSVSLCILVIIELADGADGGLLPRRTRAMKAAASVANVRILLRVRSPRVRRPERDNGLVRRLPR